MVQMSHFGIVFEFCFTVFHPPKAYILTARDLSKARPRRTMVRKNCSSDLRKTLDSEFTCGNAKLYQKTSKVAKSMKSY